VQNGCDRSIGLERETDADESVVKPKVKTLKQKYKAEYGKCLE